MTGYKTNNLPWGCSEGEHHQYNYEISSFISWDTAAKTMVNYNPKLRGTAEFRQNHPPKASDFSDPRFCWLVVLCLLVSCWKGWVGAWMESKITRFFFFGIPPRQWEFPDPKVEVRKYHISGHILGTDWLEVPTIYKAYFSGDSHWQYLSIHFFGEWTSTTTSFFFNVHRGGQCSPASFTRFQATWGCSSPKFTIVVGLMSYPNLWRLKG